MLTSDHMVQSHAAAAVPQGRPDLSAVIRVYPLRSHKRLEGILVTLDHGTSPADEPDDSMQRG